MSAAALQQQPAASRKHLLMEQLLRLIPADYQLCPQCGKFFTLQFGIYGPHLRCKDPQCPGKHTVEYGLIAVAVQNATLSCSCGGKLQLRQGKTSFLGCTNSCRNPIAWRDV
jgi:ssDNA-binding Zn-finger/Zn-ribbon topoisomerase 1